MEKRPTIVVALLNVFRFIQRLPVRPKVLQLQLFSQCNRRPIMKSIRLSSMTRCSGFQCVLTIALTACYAPPEAATSRSSSLGGRHFPFAASYTLVNCSYCLCSTAFANDSHPHCALSPASQRLHRMCYQIMLAASYASSLGFLSHFHSGLILP